MLDAAQFTGPLGGMLAVAFAMGCVAGWGFAQKTILASANQRIGELKDDLEKATRRIEALEDQRFELAREG